MNRRSALLFLLSLLLCSFAIKDEGTQPAYYKCGEASKIDHRLFKMQFGKIYFSFHQGVKPADLKAKDYFTAYLVNASDSLFHVPRQDGSLIMIQEAINEQGEWTPIEHWISSGCGNSYFSPLKLEAGNYVMIPIKQYKGRYKTKIRLKLRKKDGTNFYSEPFKRA